MTTNVLDMARFYDGLGISVIPLKANSKKPAIPAWKPYQDRRADHDQQVKWFAGGKRNIGIVCGYENLVVRDFDAQASYDQWQASFPDMAAQLPTVQTARGRHVYCRTADPIKSRCLDDGELRSNGNYVVAPPSIHPDGITYTWTRAPHDWIPIIDPVSAGLVNAIPEMAVTQEIIFLCDTSHPLQSIPVFQPASPHSIGSLVKKVVSSLNEGDELVADLISRAIRKSQPAAVGQRHRCIFELARYLKQIDRLANEKPDYEIFRRWFAAASPVIGTKEFQVSWNDFGYAWRHLRAAKGLTLRAAADRADESLVPAKVRGDRMRRLVAICLELQRIHGSKPFFLDCRNAGLLLNVGYKTAHRMLRSLCDEGILTKESTGSFASGKANEYRVNFLADT